MLKTTLDSFAQLFKTEICDRSDEIDPGEEHDWYGISLGWAIAKGMSIDDAFDFSRYVRYDLGYFKD